MRCLRCLIGFIVAGILIFSSWYVRQVYIKQFHPARIQQHLQQQVDSLPFALQNLGNLRLGSIGKPYNYYHFSKEKLFIWNDEEFPIEILKTPLNKYVLEVNNHTQLIIIAQKKNSFTSVISLPLVRLHHPLPALFPKGVIGFEAQTASYSLQSSPTASSLPLLLPDGKKLWLDFDADEWLSIPPPPLSRLLFLFGVMCMFFWSFILSERVKVLHGSERAFALFLLLLSIPLLVLYFYPIPEQLKALPIFNPLLFASNVYIPSLAHLLLIVISLLFIVGFLIKNRLFINYQPKGQWERWATATILMLLIVVIFIGLQYLAYTLIFDSGISLQVTKFSVLNALSFLLITIAAVLFGTLLVLIAHINFFFAQLLFSFWQKLIIRTFFITLLYALLGSSFAFSSETSTWFTDNFSLLSGIWLLAFLTLVDVWHIGKKELHIFHRKLIFWTIFCTLGITSIVHLFNNQKDRIIRLAVAESLVDRRNYLFEWEITKWMQTWQQDSTIYALGQLDNSKDLAQYLYTNYPFAHAHSFQKAHPSFGKEILVASAPHASLLFDETSFDDTKYKLRISDYVINFSFNHFAPQSIKKNEFFKLPQTPEYYYARYNNDLLTYQSVGGSFPAQSPPLYDKINWFTYEQGRLLVYRSSPTKSIAVYAPLNGWWNWITLFSYFFCSLLFIGIIISCLYYLVKYIYSNREGRSRMFITLSNKVNYVQLTMLVAVLFLTGYTSHYFLKRHHMATQKKEMREHLISTQKQWSQDAFLDSTKFWQNRCAQLENDFKASNIYLDYYDAQGILVCGKKHNERNYPIAERVPLFVLLEAKGNPRMIIPYQQKIGDESFEEIFTPISNAHGGLLGFAKFAPDPTKKEELNGMLDSIAITTVNIYTLIFLLMAFASLYLSRGLSRGLNLIISKFEGTTLQDNKLTDWERNDELGRLMNAYNKMANNLQEHARRLKLTERESAWREMAQQVAHEIKNPLTPMKLNIQFLNKLVQENNQLAIQKAPEIFQNLIFQIDQLNIIATEFSHFAKMPHQHSEKLDIRKVIKLNTALFQGVTKTTINCQLADKPMWVMADPLHLNRMMTNLIKNAIQAIPGDRKGEINIRAHSQEAKAFIQISDNGTGVPEELRNKMFQPLFTTKGSGTGLGLAMTRKIIEDMGGTIKFESEKGKGTTFFISLPLAHEV